MNQSMQFLILHACCHLFYVIFSNILKANNSVAKASRDTW